ncbi:hypothetical protein D3C85_1281960 [compost metagenome]
MPRRVGDLERGRKLGPAGSLDRDLRIGRFLRAPFDHLVDMQPEGAAAFVRAPVAARRPAENPAVRPHHIGFAERQ